MRHDSYFSFSLAQFISWDWRADFAHLVNNHWCLYDRKVYLSFHLFLFPQMSLAANTEWKIVFPPEIFSSPLITLMEKLEFSLIFPWYQPCIEFNKMFFLTFGNWRFFESSAFIWILSQFHNRNKCIAVLCSSFWNNLPWQLYEITVLQIQWSRIYFSLVASCPGEVKSQLNNSVNMEQVNLASQLSIKSLSKKFKLLKQLINLQPQRKQSFALFLPDLWE